MSLLGQSRALGILESALRSGRFHHAWIFSGPRGVGKFTAAVEVARVLLDPEASLRLPVEDRTTRIQKLIDAGTHPDLHIVRKELAKYSDNRDLRDKKQINIPLDLLRERIIGGQSGPTYHEAPAYRTAQLGHGKVFIIDEAELLDPNGQNVMLKTLEEPPGETYFFLITSRPDRLLPTVRSRCQHVRFSNLDEASMKQWLQSAKLPEGVTPDSKALAWVQRFAEGSPGVALLALEYEFYAWQQTLEPMLADLERGKFPAAMGAALGEMIESFAQAWVKKHGGQTSKDAANKDGSRYVLALLASHARSRLRQASSDDGGVEIEGEYGGNGGGPVQRWIAAIDLLRDAERQLESNVNVKLLMENLVVQWNRCAMRGQGLGVRV